MARLGCSPTRGRKPHPWFCPETLLWSSGDTTCPLPPSLLAPAALQTPGVGSEAESGVQTLWPAPERPLELGPCFRNGPGPGHVSQQRLTWQDSRTQTPLSLGSTLGRFQRFE